MRGALAVTGNESVCVCVCVCVSERERERVRRESVKKERASIKLPCCPWRAVRPDLRLTCAKLPL